MKIFKIVLALFLIMSMPVHAEPKFFIDDIVDDFIDDKVDEVVDKFTPFIFNIKDQEGFKKIISNEPRRLELIFKYKKNLAKRIAAIDEDDFEDAINNNLRIESNYTTEDDEGDFFSGDIEFKLESVKNKSNDGDFFEAHFISDEIIVDTPQKILFELDLIDFMEEVGVIVKSFSKTPERKLKFVPVPINLELVAIEQSSSIADTSSVLPNYILNSSFNFPDGLDDQVGDISFLLKNKSKKIKPKASIKAKGAKRKIKMDVSLDNNLDIEIKDLSNGLYGLNIPVTLNLRNFRESRFFSPGKNYSISVPFELETRTQSGLEARVRGIAKGEFVY